MNGFLILASVSLVLIGLIHSVLGERMIFTPIRQHKKPLIAELASVQPFVKGIVWANWHLTTLLAFGLAAMLLGFAASDDVPAFVLHSISVAMFASSVLVYVATRGRHPGWVGLLAVGVLCLLGLYF